MSNLQCNLFLRFGNLNLTNVRSNYKCYFLVNGTRIHVCEALKQATLVNYAS